MGEIPKTNLSYCLEHIAAELDGSAFASLYPPQLTGSYKLRIVAKIIGEVREFAKRTKNQELLTILNQEVELV